MLTPRVDRLLGDGMPSMTASRARMDLRRWSNARGALPDASSPSSSMTSTLPHSSGCSVLVEEGQHTCATPDGLGDGLSMYATLARTSRRCGRTRAGQAGLSAAAWPWALSRARRTGWDGPRRQCHAEPIMSSMPWRGVQPSRLARPIVGGHQHRRIAAGADPKSCSIRCPTTDSAARSNLEVRVATA